MEESMKSIFVIALLQLFSLAVGAITCKELIVSATNDSVANSIDANSQKFSAARMRLKELRTEILGRRYGTKSSGGLSGGGTTRGPTPSTSPESQALRFKQAPKEIARLIEILDPPPPEHSEVPTLHKITLRHDEIGNISYFYKKIPISADALAYMSEVITAAWAAAKSGEIEKEFSDDLIRSWFAQATQQHLWSASHDPISVNEMGTSLLKVMLDLIEQLDSKSESFERQKNNYIKLFNLYSKNSTDQKIKLRTKFNRMLESMKAIFGLRTSDNLYNQFVNMLLFSLENPTATTMTEISPAGHGQYTIEINSKKLQDTLTIYARHRAYFLPGSHNQENQSSHWGVTIPNFEDLVTELKAYQNSTKLGMTAEKNSLLQFSLLMVVFQRQMKLEDYNLLLKEVRSFYFDRNNSAYSFFYDPLLKHFKNEMYEVNKAIEAILTLATMRTD